jgi:hypothetical protein
LTLGALAAAHPAAAARDGLGLWTDVEAAGVGKTGQVWVNAVRSRTLHLDIDRMAARLSGAPPEFTLATRKSPLVIELPLPDGTFGRFGIVDSPIMEPELAAKYPEIRTYAAAGLDDRTASARLDVTPQGFHAMILSVHGSVYIDPLQRGDVAHYRCYAKKDATRQAEEMPFEIGVVPADPEEAWKTERLPDAGVIAATGTHLRTYRIAVAATGEYTTYHGGTVPAALAAITTAVNRVTGIYEREVSLRMVLIANNNLIIYTNPATDPYTNNDPGQMLTENQNNINAVIGIPNYDIGHVFGTGGGGIAQISTPCGANKARGVSTLTVPNGDPFHVDYVAHEVGHQWSALHTFNSNSGSCLGNESPNSAYEPGSGSTFMGYTGLCPPHNLQNDADDYMHTRSFDQIEAYSTGPNGSCAVTTATGNNPPVPNAGSGGFVIPILTPFELTGSATDPNGDALTYCWEQYDLGPQGPPDSPSGNAPIFRSFPPVLSPTRVFPRLQDLLANTTTIGEILPSYSRTLTFRLTARDNLGGVARAQMAFSASDAAGPFVVLSPNTTGLVWVGGTNESVTWDVAGTSGAPVNAANVDILMSLDGGQTWPTVLASSTPNDGSQTIVVPALLSDSVRVKVKAVGNVFFDISNQNFRVVPTMPAPVGLDGMTPSVGYENTTDQLVVLGQNFNQFHTVDLGTDVTIVDVDASAGDTLLVDVDIADGATPGFRDLIVDDLLAADTLLAAFEVRRTTGHYVSPAGGNVFPYHTPAYAALTVANAINAASDGDSILVASNTINGTFAVTKGVVVYGGWMNNFTTRDVENVKTIVNLTTGVSIFATTGTAGIDGFVLQGGSGEPGFVPIVGRYGGAVQIQNTPSARVSQCVLQNNTANALSGFGGGGGLFGINSGVDISDNTFTANTATRGGGMFLYDCSGSVSGNTISTNVVQNDGVNTPTGAGIALEQCSDLSLIDNVVAGNTGASSGGGLWLSESTDVGVSGGSIRHHTTASNGGGVYVSASTATLTGVEIRHNTSSGSGGGLSCAGASVLVLQGNRLLWNSGVLGGGVQAGGGDVSLLHNLLVGNSSSAGGAAYLQALTGGDVIGNTLDRNNGSGGAGGLLLISNTMDVFNNIITNTNGTGVFCSGGAVSLTYNLVSNSSAGDYSGCSPGTGSMGGAPLYADTTLTDYHLTLHSPAIDAGVPGVPLADPDGSRGDLGWYGSHAFVMDQPVFPTGVVANNDFGCMALSWNRNPEPDVAVYAMYVDTVDAFVPGLGNFIGTTADTAAAWCPTDFGVSADTLYVVVSAVDNSGYAGGYSAQAMWIPVNSASPVAPLAYRLAQNVPNPFNPETVIAFSTARAGKVRLMVYDVTGRTVRRLLDEQRPPGEYRVRWNGRADDGRAMPSGHYYYRLELGGQVLTRTMVLLK